MFKYDFYITENNHFIVPDLDIELLYSPTESTIPEMPQATESTVKIAGRDGDQVLATTYEPKEFTLVLYTDDNLNANEKTLEINKITTFLNSLKNDYKKMAFLLEEKMYSVKYNRQLVVVKLPKCVRFELPLKSSKSFGTELYSKKIIGEGSKISNTIEPVGCIVTINGYASNPKISINNYQMEYDNTILSGNKLVIDTGNSTITHITSLGVKTNAAIYYNHQYPKIKAGKNEVDVISGISDDTQVTVEWYDLKL